MIKKIPIIIITWCFIGSAGADIVKLSNNKICHDEYSASFSKTKRYIAYNSLQECLEAGGRLPKKRNGSSISNSEKQKYNRKQFSHWSDEDGDCMNTRHETLHKLSTSTIILKNKCNVDRGRWIDPYTNQIFYSAKNLDVDHLVPLKWAWEHGADKWTAAQRRTFANDERNLFAVKASVNRAKGAAGPLTWLPPNTSFHCQYVVQFMRITKFYGFALNLSEASKISKLKVDKCGS